MAGPVEATAEAEGAEDDDDTGAAEAEELADAEGALDAALLALAFGPVLPVPDGDDCPPVVLAPESPHAMSNAAARPNDTATGAAD